MRAGLKTDPLLPHVPDAILEEDGIVSIPEDATETTRILPARTVQARKSCKYYVKLPRFINDGDGHCYMWKGSKYKV